MLPLLLALACSGGATDDSGPASPDDTGATSSPDDTGATGDTDLPPPGEAVSSDAARDLDPDVDSATLRAHTEDMRALALDLLHETVADEAGADEAGADEAGADENLFMSPYSISVALAMTYAGAEGATATQMADALHFDLPESTLHPAFNALDLALAGRADEVPDGDDTGDGFELTVVNQLFGQTGYPFQAPFLDTLAVHYGAGLRLLDFASDPDGNRVAINDWVASVTADRIEDLLPKGAITTYTKLVLVNAIYFKASWSAPFAPESTADAAFTTLAGGTVTVPTMHGAQETLYGTGEGFAIVDLPYVGEQLTMTLLVPDAGRFAEVRDGLDVAGLDAALDGMSGYEVTLAVPKWSFRSQLDLVPPMQALGMVDAFDSSLADFSGMSTESQLFVSGIFHQAFVAVDETGTEAAAATAVVVGDESEPERAELVVDRPFLFLIRDRPTGAVLFLGQVVDPS